MCSNKPILQHYFKDDKSNRQDKNTIFVPSDNEHIILNTFSYEKNQKKIRIKSIMTYIKFSIVILIVFVFLLKTRQKLCEKKNYEILR